jgi:hypothetical protein
LNDAPTPLERLRSAYHGLSLFLSERSGRVRAPAPPVAAGTLPLESVANVRANELATRFRVRFEEFLDYETALQAYEYLHFLDDLATSANLRPASGGELHDVGCASFGYASALAAALQPRSITGFDVEGYRRLKGGINRAERATAHVAAVPGAAFRIADYRRIRDPADHITLFFPFVTPAPVLGWRMPLSLLAPAELFGSAAANLRAGGMLWMVNHSSAEAAIAARHATAAGLGAVARREIRSPFRARSSDPVASVWTAARRHGT